MRVLSIFKQFKKYLSNTYVPLVSIILIMLFTASCSTVQTRQTASTDTAATSLTTKEKSDNETANTIDAVECRTVEITGTRFKKKVCEYKETWADIDKKNKKESEKFVRGIDEQSGVVAGGNDPAGRMNTPMSPGGQ